MKCPKCNRQNSKVVESRDANESGAIRRRRECLSCQYRFTTYERLERPNLAVIKKNGDRELFDRQKLFVAIHRSVGKFFASQMEVEDVVDRVEEVLFGMNVSEVTSSQVGDIVLEELARRNEVAYIRFASVYREFKTIPEFAEALKRFQ